VVKRQRCSVMVYVCVYVFNFKHMMFNFQQRGGIYDVNVLVYSTVQQVVE